MKKLSFLIVEDDKNCSEMLKSAFEEDGHIARIAGSIQECHKALSNSSPDMIVLDRGLPDGDGIQLCLNLKKDPKHKRTPILMLTAKSQTTEKILGLRFGADDYLPKPFDIEELRARVDAIIRRMSGIFSTLLSCGELTLNVKSREVTFAGRPVQLTCKEFSLLRFLMESHDTALSRESILTAVWGNSTPTSPKVIDVTVMNLRRKIGGEKSPIVAIHSYGYKLNSMA